MYSGKAPVEIKALFGGPCSGLEIPDIYLGENAWYGGGGQLSGKKAQVSYVKDRVWVDFINVVDSNV
jgi:hypothetical protein